jgi:hypothetical protein
MKPLSIRMSVSGPLRTYASVRFRVLASARARAPGGVCEAPHAAHSAGELLT